MELVSNQAPIKIRDLTAEHPWGIPTKENQPSN